MEVCTYFLNTSNNKKMSHELLYFVSFSTTFPMLCFHSRHRGKVCLISLAFHTSSVWWCFCIFDVKYVGWRWWLMKMKTLERNWVLCDGSWWELDDIKVWIEEILKAISMFSGNFMRFNSKNWTLFGHISCFASWIRIIRFTLLYLYFYFNVAIHLSIVKLEDLLRL